MSHRIIQLSLIPFRKALSVREAGIEGGLFKLLRRATGKHYRRWSHQGGQETAVGLKHSDSLRAPGG